MPGNGETYEKEHYEKSSRISAVYHRSSSVRTVCTGCSFNRRKLGTDQFRIEVFKS